MNSKLFDLYLKLTTEAEVQGGGIQLYVTSSEKTLLKLDFKKSFTNIIGQKCRCEEISDTEIDNFIFDLSNLFNAERQFVLCY